MMDDAVERRLGRAPSRTEEPRREEMVEPEAVAAMLRLKGLGWGSKRIATISLITIAWCRVRRRRIVR